MDATDPATDAADAFIKTIRENDTMAPDFVDKLFRVVHDLTGCTRNELPDISIRAMAQAHKDNTKGTKIWIKLVLAAKEMIEKLTMENAELRKENAVGRKEIAVLSKENQALKKKVQESELWLEDGEDSEEWVDVSVEHVD